MLEQAPGGDNAVEALRHIDAGPGSAGEKPGGVDRRSTDDKREKHGEDDLKQALPAAEPGGDDPAESRQGYIGPVAPFVAETSEAVQSWILVLREEAADGNVELKGEERDCRQQRNEKNPEGDFTPAPGAVGNGIRDSRKLSRFAGCVNTGSRL